eukprot:TRINITY_DN6513_c2_g1_i1.p1 TRINITY_DN6513_c2_g1~~TRINITY_DN6513_c2_g1_i1.p1  ORF type:complete len:160 (-),score=40.29 TRINITY_DN6513_c2_g1_i1:492-971(-)
MTVQPTGKLELSKIKSALLSTPYVDKEKEEILWALYPTSNLITSHYLDLDISGLDATHNRQLFWQQAFSKYCVTGQVNISQTLLQKFGVLPDYNQAKVKVANILGISVKDMNDVHTTIEHGWKIWDVRFGDVQELGSQVLSLSLIMEEMELSCGVGHVI